MIEIKDVLDSSNVSETIDDPVEKDIKAKEEAERQRLIKLANEKIEKADKGGFNALCIIPMFAYMKYGGDAIYGEGENPFEPTLEDLGTLIEGVLDCIPIVGGLISSITEDQKITKKQLEERLEKFKKEMIEIIDKKIKESEVQQWKVLCGTYLRALGIQSKDVEECLIALKIGIVEKDPQLPILKSDVKSSLNMLRKDIKTVMTFCSREEFAKETIPYYVETLFIYAITMTNLEYFWYHFGYHWFYAYGREKDTLGLVKSFKHKLHNTITKGITHIMKYSENDDDLVKISKLLSMDLEWYSIPVTIEPLNQPSLCVKLYQRSEVSTPVVNMKNKVPYIHRVDGANFRPDPHGESMVDGRRYVPELDPVSKCRGVAVETSPSIKIQVDGKKMVQLRIFGAYGYNRIYSEPIYNNDEDDEDDEEFKNSSKSNLKISTLHGYGCEVPLIQTELGCKWTTEDTKKLGFKIGSGITETTKILVDGSMEFKIEPMNRNVSGKILFVEFILTEPSIRDLSSKPNYIKEWGKNLIRIDPKLIKEMGLE
eukprot:gene11941-14616_t